MKKILVNYTGKKGGGAEYAFEMVKSLSKLDIDIYVILSKKVTNLKDWRTLKVKIIEIDTYNSLIGLIFRFLLFKTFYLKYLLREIPINIDYIYVPMEQPLTMVINEVFKNARVFLTIHDVNPHSGDNKFFHYINGFLNFNTRSNSYKIILLSNIFVDEFVAKYNRIKNDIIVVKHGLFNRFQLLTPKAVPLTHVKNENFLFFGRISLYKGLEILLDAFEIYQKSNPESTLTIAGEGNLSKYKKISSLVNLNIINRWISDSEIQYLFKIPNLILVTPYTDASQSGVIRIANLMKVPVISSNAGGLIEQVENNHTGLLFSIGDVSDLVTRMYVLKNKNFSNKITDNAFLSTLSFWDESAKILFSYFI